MPEDVKQRRLAEIIAVYREQLYAEQARELSRRHLVLVEGPSRRSGAHCSLAMVCLCGAHLWGARLAHTCRAAAPASPARQASTPLNQAPRPTLPSTALVLQRLR